jgi:hypothetical protein
MRRVTACPWVRGRGAPRGPVAAGRIREECILVGARSTACEEHRDGQEQDRVAKNRGTSTSLVERAMSAG